MSVLKHKLKQHQDKLKNLSMRVFKAKSLVLSQRTPYKVIAELETAQVRYYAAANKKYTEPLVFVAPLAINMSIYDLYPYRSQVKYFTDAGFDVYLIDWGKLTFAHRHLNFLNFINDAIPHCIAQIQQHAKTDQISLHGWSMAGLFVLLYTALHQPHAVKNLIVLGSPIDSWASGNIGLLYQKLNALLCRLPKLQQRLYSEKIPHHFIHSLGLLNALGFKIIDPKGWYDGHKQLLMNLDNPKFIHEHATLGHFLNHMIDYPGGINQDMLFNIWLQNPLKSGHIKIQQQQIDLKNIKCSLMVGAGISDQMVTAAAVKPLVDLTSSPDVSFQLIPGGHLGLMSNQNSADQFWPQLKYWLEQRSTLI
ncbi:polyhydroxyalkanoate synthase [Acinetobacter calcoaceticus]|uniref:Polyhydroxyalkanoate synthase n=1 Tax=Acinetobacter calcoaceticus TaxID=471 RepID=A0A4R1XN39_ACICA|nr:polyhydroxyalkanoate synthase [Acinetobacter calcoaceticus]